MIKRRKQPNKSNEIIIPGGKQLNDEFKFIELSKCPKCEAPHVNYGECRRVGAELDVGTFEERIKPHIRDCFDPHQKLVFDEDDYNESYAKLMLEYKTEKEQHNRMYIKLVINHLENDLMIRINRKAFPNLKYSVIYVHFNERRYNEIIKMKRKIEKEENEKEWNQTLDEPTNLGKLSGHKRKQGGKSRASSPKRMRNNKNELVELTLNECSENCGTNNLRNSEEIMNENSNENDEEEDTSMVFTPIDITNLEISKPDGVTK